MRPNRIILKIVLNGALKHENVNFLIKKLSSVECTWDLLSAACQPVHVERTSFSSAFVLKLRPKSSSLSLIFTHFASLLTSSGNFPNFSRSRVFSSHNFRREGIYLQKSLKILTLGIAAESF